MKRRNFFTLLFAPLLMRMGIAIKPRSTGLTAQSGTLGCVPTGTVVNVTQWMILVNDGIVAEWNGCINGSYPNQYWHGLPPYVVVANKNNYPWSTADPIASINEK